MILEVLLRGGSVLIWIISVNIIVSWLIISLLDCNNIHWTKTNSCLHMYGLFLFAHNIILSIQSISTVICFLIWILLTLGSLQHLLLQIQSHKFFCEKAPQFNVWIKVNFAYSFGLFCCHCQRRGWRTVRRRGQDPEHSWVSKIWRYKTSYRTRVWSNSQKLQLLTNQSLEMMPVYPSHKCNQTHDHPGKAYLTISC